MITPDDPKYVIKYPTVLIHCGSNVADQMWRGLDILASKIPYMKAQAGFAPVNKVNLACTFCAQITCFND